MKILLVHNYYKQSGGEDSVLAAERTLLESHGHEVILFTVNNEGIRGVVEKLKVAWKTAYSGSMKKTLVCFIKDLKPDIVHVHNFFPLISPSVYDACRVANVPVVQTLHNFRLICPGALLMRAGRICELCLDCSPYRSGRYGCYRGSRLGTLAVARMVATHKNSGTWNAKVDRFVALTEFARSKFIAAGFPAGKMVVKPNFVQIQEIPATFGKRTGALFVGRLSSEKGISTLLAAWKNIDQTLKIIGEGPLFSEAQKQHSANIDFMGRRALPDVLAAMVSSQFLAMPSICYEGFPMVLVEAFACGLPVIASRLGAMAEIIEDGVTGLLFTPGDEGDLATKTRWAFDHPDEMRQMGKRARSVCEEKYSSEENYRQLMAIYEGVVGQQAERENT